MLSMSVMQVQNDFRFMVELIQHVAKSRHAMDKAEILQCRKVCEVAKEVCRRGIARLVAAAEHRPCLQSCGCDGTPIQVSLAMQTHLPAGRVIRRAGKASHEFYVAANFVR